MGGISHLGSPALHNAGAYRLQIVGAGKRHSSHRHAAHDAWSTMVVPQTDYKLRVPDFCVLMVWQRKRPAKDKTRHLAIGS